MTATYETILRIVAARDVKILKGTIRKPRQHRLSRATFAITATTVQIDGICFISYALIVCLYLSLVPELGVRLCHSSRSTLHISRNHRLPTC